MTPGHFVPYRDLPLLRDVDLHELHHARRQLIRLESLVDLLLCLALHALDPALSLLDHSADALARPLVPHLERAEVEPVELDARQDVLGELGPLVDVGLHRSPLQRQRHGIEREDLPELLVPSCRDPFDLLAFQLAELTDPRSALFLKEGIIDASREDLHVDHGATHPRRNAQGRVLHVLGLLAEDRRQELLLGRELGLSLGGNLTHQDVATGETSPASHDATLVKVDQALFGHVRDLAGDLLHPALCVPDVQFELLNVDRREHVLLDQLLADDDGVFVVVPVPGHEGDEHVAAER